MSEGTKREVIRITLLGDQSVGKTTIRSVFLKLDFEENTLSTVGTNKSETKFTLKDGKYEIHVPSPVDIGELAWALPVCSYPFAPWTPHC